VIRYTTMSRSLLVFINCIVLLLRFKKSRKIYIIEGITILVLRGTLQLAVNLIFRVVDVSLVILRKYQSDRLHFRHKQLKKKKNLNLPYSFFHCVLVTEFIVLVK
jgi:hypothetical protein